MNLGLKGAVLCEPKKIFVANAWSFMVVVRIGKPFERGAAGH
jgi:hypothetical protein